MKKQKNIAILGSTGSIGTQALEIIKNYPDKFQAEILVANNNIDLLIKQAIEYQPNIVVIGQEKHYESLKNSLKDLPIKVFAGAKAIQQVVQMDCVDLVLTAMVGFSGLLPTIKAIEANKTIALANKETLVVAGHIINNLLLNNKSQIIPVDSEHSAIFQCLLGENLKNIDKLILTASGGPFRGKNRDFLKTVKPEQALKHPNWNMGNKVTIDSASLMNKGLELIEAHWLFGIDAKNIEVVIHPQSIIHSLVEFIDGSIKAQLGVPSMRIPIQYALDFPNRTVSNKDRFSFKEIQSLSFEQVDLKTFKNLQIAIDCLNAGGSSPCVMNAANEIAVELFLQEKISFLGISDLIEESLAKIDFIANPSLEDCVYIDNITRKKSFELSKKIK
ncbi:MAG: 1-deoxy-D-xylulose-5-phosphate reductoisomerase [Bacteroidales bacterium]|jgi:1-deoxy-D-xylulose-5-phosphate reductoisomerase|nr:1-deoxy-D-xylulose-5-phosphate reductoisomerase [Bacteroidales bacterium]MCK9498098.1 1-deoxy-D-xylulose-5-phosphate reductoisomerase [Bacteroidales bacterium]MDY0313588.1 1-deoxy-D-xylulose-5-phosphate reductoisomerase [Bacteroidales bacterium]